MNQCLVCRPRRGARAETMFDKTRLPYVALDVLCVVLGTYAPPAGGACVREPGVGAPVGAGVCLLGGASRRAAARRGGCA